MEPKKGPAFEPVQTAGILAACGLFVLGFLLTACMLHLLLPNPLHLHADMRSEKLVMLDRLHGSVYSAAFGSSHVHNGFNPAVFDRELALSTPGTAGIRTQTMNLAIEGGSQSEQRVMAQQFLAQLSPPPGHNACFVLLELDAGANLQNEHLVHPRSINIYDWKTARFISHLTGTRMSLSRRLGRVGFALAAAGLHYSNVGMLSNWIFAPSLNQELLTDELENDRRGQKIESPPGDAMLAQYRKLLAAGASAQPSADELTPGNQELIAELKRQSHLPGITFVYFTYPRLDDAHTHRMYPESVQVDGKPVPIINLADASRYPQLYQPKLWHDQAHTDEDGAIVISKLLADQVKAWYATHGGVPDCEAR